MVKIVFVCHGNICRSPMAEFIFKDIVKKNGKEDLFEVRSAAMSREEIGSDIYPPAKAKLREKGIPFGPRRARQITLTDCSYFDLIILMDENNMRYYQRLFGEAYIDKVHLLMDYAVDPREVEDPWYTRDFEKAFNDIKEGCEGLYDHLMADQSC